MANDYLADLFHLVWFRFRASWLKIENLQDALFRENVMAASNSFIKPQMSKQCAQTCERDICVRCASQNLKQSALGLSHARYLTIALGQYSTSVERLE
jgi:hypothetical protein